MGSTMLRSILGCGYFTVLGLGNLDEWNSLTNIARINEKNSATHNSYDTEREQIADRSV